MLMVERVQSVTLLIVGAEEAADRSFMDISAVVQQVFDHLGIFVNDSDMQRTFAEVLIT